MLSHTVAAKSTPCTVAPLLERVTVAIEKPLLARFDRWLRKHGLSNCSEAVRDLIRARLVEDEEAQGEAEAVASLTLIYDNAQRELSDRLTAAGH
jgi:CopG family nickel-responsive transcriptional regulator